MDVQQSVKQITVGAIHELPLLAWDENCYMIKIIIFFRLGIMINSLKIKLFKLH
jgi:hypothetical protein